VFGTGLTYGLGACGTGTITGGCGIGKQLGQLPVYPTGHAGGTHCGHTPLKPGGHSGVGYGPGGTGDGYGGGVGIGNGAGIGGGGIAIGGWIRFLHLYCL
jgi:hypothetical protein